ncbi:MAG: hypothetical protein KDA44_00580 [Planctomycetales bacterium]|nr:hypothetical protein [Planctomycetales bacterium]
MAGIVIRKLSFQPATWSTIASLCIAMGFAAPRAEAAITAISTRGQVYSELDGSISSTDVLNGLIATELPGDQGWHPANPATSNGSLDPNGLPAFTDGAGGFGGLTGLLNDFPGAGVPTKVIQFDLASPTNIGQINVLSGNRSNADGRIFSTFVIRYSTNGGSSFSPLGGFVRTFDGNVITDTMGYYQSDPSGVINNETGIPGVTEDMANLVEIFDDSAETLVAGVTNLQFDFYAVDNTLGENRDPFDGLNPFTGIDDGLSAAFVAPLLWEIDVFESAAAADDADFTGDGKVDGADFLRWQRNYPVNDMTAVLTDGDANGDHNVDGADLAIWQTQYGTGASAIAVATAVPEPSGVVAALIAAASLVLWLRRGRDATPFDAVACL